MNKSRPSSRTRRRSLPRFNALDLWHVHDIMAATSGKEYNQRFAIRREGGEFRVRNRVGFVAARANLNWAEWTGLQQLPQLVRIHADSIPQPSDSFKLSMKADRLKSDTSTSSPIGHCASNDGSIGTGQVPELEIVFICTTEQCSWTAHHASRCQQIWTQVIGADADFRLADSPAEPDKIIEGLTTGATAHLKMRAVNETGPGAFGESVQVIVE